MKKRTVLTILLAMVFALSFAWTAAAAETEDACIDCGKCPERQIACCVTVGQADPYATYFDYETSTGYCPNQGRIDHCKVIFDLCECDDPNTNFVTDAPIGVHMTILNSGVYFTDDSVAVNTYTTSAEACLGGTSDYPWSWATGDMTYYDAAGKEVTPMAIADANPYDCVVPCDAYAMELVTDVPFVLPGELVTGQYKYWWIDLPAMVLNDPEIKGREGEMIRIEVCLQGVTGGICQDCNDICCCIIDLGTLCCEAYECQRTCIYFPYVVTGLTNIGWSTGVAITNVGGSPSMDLTLTITDSTGEKFVYTKEGHTATVWSFYIDAILSGFSGTPAAGPAMLEVKSSEGVIDGYVFLSDGNFGGSTMARECGCSSGF